MRLPPGIARYYWKHAVGSSALVVIAGIAAFFSDAGWRKTQAGNTLYLILQYGPLVILLVLVEEDVERQKLNVFRMRLLGTEVRSVSSGSRTLKDAINEAFRDWVGNLKDTYYIFGSTVGPHPYPLIVRDFQRVIGRGGPGPDPRNRSAASRGLHCLRKRRKQRHRPLLRLSR